MEYGVWEPWVMILGSYGYELLQVTVPLSTIRMARVWHDSCFEISFAGLVCTL